MDTFKAIKPSRAGVIALYLIYAAEVARTLTSPRIEDEGWYVALFLLFLVLFTAVLWRPDIPRALLHLYLIAQCAITLALLARNPELDFVTALFPFLAYQAALVFPSRTRWVWVGILFALTGGSLMVFLDPIRGLALSLTTMAFCIVLPAFVVANEQTEHARAASQALVAELQTTHERLQAYADQAEELSTIEERTRLARELHDSVSQTMFSIILNTRSTQILLERDPTRLRPQLEQLQGLTQNALAQMRSLIAELRPKSS